ncbi:glycoside hydrolase family 36 protein [Streptomyces aidingensis]|uniref:Alpha-galactosidase n=1 Tax=Streptomyces aidingensis TaxID=910347 RepID=A0A1I1SJ12_9ACTN|nr:glycoside hydrolase family 36 protein [Streptomyces aidingensis]SFD46292.1 alpha-galactosidase [Streptomyces aidingensis]
MYPSLLIWCGGQVTLHFRATAGQPVSLLSLRPADLDRDPPDGGPGAPLVEIQELGHGRFPGSHRYADTVAGSRLRYAGHNASRDERAGLAELRIRQTDPATGLRVTSVFQAAEGVPAVRTWTEASIGPGHPGRSVCLQAVTSVVTSAFHTDSGAGPDHADLLHGDSDWVAESRWHRTPLRRAGLPYTDPDVHHHPSRSRFALTSRSSWSTGEHLPTGVLAARDGSWSLAWQIEHNGAWHWEVYERREGDTCLALLGPTDAEHQWSETVTERRPFTTVPVSLAVAAGGPDEALGALTRQRRALRARHVPAAAPRRLPVIFNDYMNTLMGDPTTARLLPLIDAAAEAGADCYCIDAGWYDEDGTWWDSVGEWRPSARRFPGGLEEVTEHIRSRGMLPGIWLEPEVIGVRSPAAGRLPADAFFQRRGRRVAEHGRYHLDLRHPEARKHVNEVVDRLVTDLGIGYFKFDYNIMPGPGTDLGGAAPGAGLLGHNRAHLHWLDSLLSRYPDLLIENCASGAMRMDYALLARLHLQSTSDQQNPLLYPAIAAAAPASVLPEQAGNWAYAQPEMSVEEAVFTLATGVLGRLCLSGRLDGMTPARLALVREAVACHRELLPFIARSLPCWPLGLAGPAGPWIAQGLRDPEPDGDLLLTLWRLPGASRTLEVPLPWLRGAAAAPETLFPRDAALAWRLRWEAAPGVLRVDCPAGGPAAAARVIRLRRP